MRTIRMSDLPPIAPERRAEIDTELDADPDSPGRHPDGTPVDPPAGLTDAEMTVLFGPKPGSDGERAEVAAWVRRVRRQADEWAGGRPYVIVDDVTPTDQLEGEALHWRLQWAARRGGDVR